MRGYRAAQGAKGKCPAGHKYSAKTKACVKVSCGGGRVWRGESQACIDGHSAALTDQDFYDEARALVDEGQFAAALDILHHIKKQEQPRVLNYIGYTTRKLGDVDKGLDYYHQALALDPNYLRAREYLGEGYLQKGDVAKAKRAAHGDRRPLRGCLRGVWQAGKGDRDLRHRRANAASW